MRCHMTNPLSLLLQKGKDYLQVDGAGTESIYLDKINQIQTTCNTIASNATCIAQNAIHYVCSTGLYKNAPTAKISLASCDQSYTPSLYDCANQVLSSDSRCGVVSTTGAYVVLGILVGAGLL